LPRIVEVNYTLAVAPSVLGWPGRRKSLAIAANVAISPDMIEDQIDPRLKRMNRILRIDVQPSYLTAVNRIVESLQNPLVDRTSQAGRPIFLLKILRYTR